MDQYIPPIYAVASAMVLVLLCFTLRIPFFIIGLFSVFFVIYSLRDHFYRFTVDYQSFSAPDFLKQNASTLIITIVILMSLGFLLLRFGPTAVVMNRPIEAVPGQRSSWTSGWFGQGQNKSNSGNSTYNSMRRRYEDFLKVGV